MTTYENRIRRSVEKNTAELRALQAQRKAAIAQAEEEAVLLVQLAQTEGGDYDPTGDFPPEFQPLGFLRKKTLPFGIKALRGLAVPGLGARCAAIFHPRG